jgi:hypothetical protein
MGQPPRRARAGRVGALVVAGAVGAACYAATRPSGGAPVASLAVDAASSSSGEVGVRITNAYGAWDAGTLYPWAHVVEPFRDTKFQVASDETCAMTLAHVDLTGAEVRAGEAPFAITTLDEPNAMTAVFTRAAGDYVLKVTCDDAAGGAPKARTINLKAKYVRREIRTLHAGDLARYMNATALVHTLSLAAGQARFGPKFKNYEYFTAKHLDKRSIDECTPYHDGDVFLTAHAAFSLEFEQALQAIDPSLASPYWDYTLDDEKYGEDWAAESAIFSKNMFGSYGASRTSEGHRIGDGPLVGARVATQGAMNRTDWPESNSFGRLTEAWNADDTLFVGRADTICELETKARLPGCSKLALAIAASNSTAYPGAFLPSFENAIETGFHAELHGMLGGAWGCEMRDGTSLSMKAFATAYPETRKILEILGVYLNLLWRSVYKRDPNCGACDMAVTCPASGTCSSGDGSCRCFSAAFEEAYAAAKDDDEKLLRLANEALRVDAINSAMKNAQAAVGLWQNTTGNVQFIGPDGAPLSAGANNALKIFLAKLVLHPAKVAPYATPLAASNDPLFWVTHNAWERVWHYVQLHPSTQYGNALYADSAERLKQYWDVNHAGLEPYRVCWGRYWDAKLPFSDFLGEGNHGQDYTNGELMQIFQPTNPDLPFVYHNLRWDHCPAADH